MRNTVNPRVIEWALNRCHKTPEDLKNTVSPRVQQWIDGEGKPPTAKQLEKLAKATHVLVPYFFDDDVPELPLQIPDYRTLDASTPIDPSPAKRRAAAGGARAAGSDRCSWCRLGKADRGA